MNSVHIVEEDFVHRKRPESVIHSVPSEGMRALEYWCTQETQDSGEFVHFDFETCA